MKKNEIIKIGKEEFTLCKYFNPYVRCMDLYDAYMKPSQMKKNIWEYWRNWFHENKEGFNDFIAIGSYNFCQFQVVGRITLKGIKYNFYIKKSGNEICLVNE